MTVVLRMLRRISERLGVDSDEANARTEKLTEETNVDELVQTLENELPNAARGDDG